MDLHDSTDFSIHFQERERFVRGIFKRSPRNFPKKEIDLLLSNFAKGIVNIKGWIVDHDLTLKDLHEWAFTPWPMPDSSLTFSVFEF